MDDLDKQYRESKAQVEKTQKELDKKILELKNMIKKQFWDIKGYPRLSTQNYGIIEDGIDFGIEAMRKVQ